MVNRIRRFLAVEAAIFIVAAFIHFEVIVDGYLDREAGTAESIIAVVLAGGLLASMLRPAITRGAGLITQGFALAGTFIGVTLLFTVGPRTMLDVFIHLLMVVVLGAGLIVTLRTPRFVSGRVTSGI